MARQQIVLQAVQQLAPNANFKVDAYIQREKKSCSSFENRENIMQSTVPSTLHFEYVRYTVLFD